MILDEGIDWMKNHMDFTTPKDFKVGDVYKMSVASRSHVKSPYYVIIKQVTEDFIETDIPGEHSLRIRFGSPEWSYHIPRMTRIGNDAKSVKLIKGQKNLFKNPLTQK